MIYAMGAIMKIFKKYRKAIYYIFITLITMLLMACDTQKENTVTDGTDERITIRWMIYGKKYPESEKVFAVFNEKLQQVFPGTTVEFEIVPLENYKSKWEMKMATNEALDLAWISSDYINYIGEVKKGNFMAIDYLLSSHGVELQQEIPEYLWKLETHDDNIYGVPVEGIQYQKESSVVVSSHLLKRYGNQDQIIQVNQGQKYADKDSFAVFEDFLQNVNDAGDIGTGVSYQTFEELANKGYEGLYGKDSTFVIRIFDNKVKVYNKYELESYKAYFETMARWYQKGFIRSDVADVLNPIQNDGKDRGSILFLAEYQNNGIGMYDFKTEYDPVIIPLQSYSYISSSACRNSIVIPKSAENPVRAMEVLNYLLSEDGKELYRLLINGIEKEHYLVLDNQTIVHMRDNSNTYLYKLSSYTIGNVFNNYESAQGEFAEIKKQNKEALKSPLIGFDLDTRMIAVELEAVNLVVKEYKTALCQGISDDWEDSYIEFVAKMKEAGSDKVIKEIQKQVDAFLLEQN